MKLLEDRIRRDGVVKDGDVLKVDSFLNHQMDVELFAEMGREWAKLFAADHVTKILTIEASGIGIACLAAQQFHVPVVFAKKNQTKNIAGDVYTAKVESFTHGRVYDIIVAKQFLNPGDRVLIIDDFLAKGAALQGLIQLVRGPPWWVRALPWKRRFRPAATSSAAWVSGWNPWPGLSPWGRAALSFANDAAV